MFNPNRSRKIRASFLLRNYNTLWKMEAVGFSSKKLHEQVRYVSPFLSLKMTYCMGNIDTQPIPTFVGKEKRNNKFKIRKSDPKSHHAT